MDSLSNKLNVLNSNIPKVMIPARSRANYYSSPENLIKYPCSNSLSSSGNNSSSGKGSFRSSVSPQSEKIAVKVVEEDVLVMDGVLVAPDTNIVRSGSSSSPGSVGFYKSEFCRTWEEYGHCGHGSKCQFAHGKEEVRPSSFPFRSKSKISSTPMKPENTPLTANTAMKPKTKKASTSTTRPDTSVTNGTYCSPYYG